MKIIRNCFILILLITASAQADQSQNILKNLRSLYSGIKDYKVTLTINVKGQNISINKMLMHIYFKRPDKIKVVALGGIGMLPAGLPLDDQIADMLKNSISIYMGSEKINGIDCHKIRLIPNIKRHKTTDTILWIDKKKNVIVRSSADKPTNMITNWTYTTIDGKFYMPKQINVETTNKFARDNDKPQKVTMKAMFTSYKINKGIKDSIFVEKKK